MLRAVGRSHRAAWRRSGGRIAGWVVFLVGAAAIPLTWAALRLPSEWVPAGAVLSVVAFVVAILLGVGTCSLVAPAELPPTSPQVEAVPDFVVTWADDATPHELLWSLARAVRRAEDLRDTYLSEPLADSLGHAWWIAEDVLAPATLDAWRLEFDRISHIAPSLNVPRDLRPAIPPAPPELRQPPSIPE